MPHATFSFGREMDAAWNPGPAPMLAARSQAAQYCSQMQISRWQTQGRIRRGRAFVRSTRPGLSGRTLGRVFAFHLETSPSSPSSPSTPDAWCTGWQSTNRAGRWTSTAPHHAMASYSQAVLRDALTTHDVTSGLRVGAGHGPEPAFHHGRLSLLQLPQAGYSTAQTALLLAPSALFLLLFPFRSLRLRRASLKVLPNYTGGFKAVTTPLWSPNARAGR